jgi:hypothetical protein
VGFVDAPKAISRGIWRTGGWRAMRAGELGIAFAHSAGPSVCAATVFSDDMNGTYGRHGDAYYREPLGC